MKVLLYSISFVLLSTLFGQAQPGQPQNPPAEPVPITGLEYLLIGGGAYGVSRLLKNRNKADKD